MTFSPDAYPARAAAPELAETITDNIAATGRLLDVLRSEADHPQALIGKEQDFMDDGSFDASVGPPLAETADPDNIGNGYLAGLRPDGAGQVIILEREKGGVVGRAVLTLREGQPTRFLGDRLIPDRPEFGLTRRETVDGQLVPPQLLGQLGAQLVRAFDVKRARINAATGEKHHKLRRLARAFLSLQGKKGAIKQLGAGEDGKGQE